MNIEFSSLALYWSFLHIPFIFMYFKGLQNYIGVIIVILAAPVFLTGQFTGDVYNSYRFGVDGSAAYDYGFILLIKVIGALGFKGDSVLYVIQCLIFSALLLLNFKYIRGNNLFVSLSVVLISVFAFLAINNVLRQGISSVFVLFCYYSLNDKNFKSYFFYSILATLMHWSAPLFIFALTVYKLVSPYLKQFLLSAINNSDRFRKISFLKLSIFCSIIIVVCISLVALFPEIESLISRNSDRYSGSLKVISISAVFLMSSLLVIRRINIQLLDFFLIRFVFFVIFLSFSVLGFPELAARILFFYFFVEMIYIIQCMGLGSRERMSGILTILSYSLAVNVLQLITNFE
ncbi:EpsG family protein [Porticoccaceae bacterium]|nr:EpsG family protein [Porticoccaceae bacterium]